MHASPGALEQTFQVNRLALLCSLVLGSSLGLLASHLDVLLVGISVLALLGLAVAGEVSLLALILLSSGLTLSFVTGGDRPFIASVGGANLDGVKLVAVLGSFGVLALRNPSLLGGLTHLRVYVLFLAVAAATLLWSPSVTDGIRFLCKLIYPAVVFLLTFQIVRERGDDALVRYCCIGAILATTVNIIFALGGWSPFQGTGYEDRYRGAAHPNSIGLYCAAVGLMVYAFWTRLRLRSLLVLSVILCIQLVATGSRTALIAGGAAFVVFELLRGHWRTTLLGILLGVALWLLVPTLGARTADLAIDSGMGSQVNLSGRVILWADAWVSFIGDGSLLGHGLGATEAFFESRYLGLRSIHNGYLLLLGDTGFIGLGLALVFLSSIAFLFVRQIRTGDTLSIYGPLSVGLVVMLLLASFMESTFGGYGPQTPLWTAMGAAFAVGMSPRVARHDP